MGSVSGKPGLVELASLGSFHVQGEEFIQPVYQFHNPYYQQQTIHMGEPWTCYGYTEERQDVAFYAYSKPITTEAFSTVPVKVFWNPFFKQLVFHTGGPFMDEVDHSQSAGFPDDPAGSIVFWAVDHATAFSEPIYNFWNTNYDKLSQHAGDPNSDEQVIDRRGLDANCYGGCEKPLFFAYQQRNPRIAALRYVTSLRAWFSAMEVHLASFGSSGLMLYGITLDHLQFPRIHTHGIAKAQCGDGGQTGLRLDSAEACRKQPECQWILGMCVQQALGELALSVTDLRVRIQVDHAEKDGINFMDIKLDCMAGFHTSWSAGLSNGSVTFRASACSPTLSIDHLSYRSSSSVADLAHDRVQRVLQEQLKLKVCGLQEQMLGLVTSASNGLLTHLAKQSAHGSVRHRLAAGSAYGWSNFFAVRWLLEVKKLLVDGGETASLFHMLFGHQGSSMCLFGRSRPSLVIPPCLAETPTELDDALSAHLPILHQGEVDIRLAGTTFVLHGFQVHSFDFFSLNTSDDSALGFALGITNLSMSFVMDLEIHSADLFNVTADIQKTVKVDVGVDVGARAEVSLDVDYKIFAGFTDRQQVNIACIDAALQYFGIKSFDHDLHFDVLSVSFVGESGDDGAFIINDLQDFLNNVLVPLVDSSRRDVNAVFDSVVRPWLEHHINTHGGLITLLRMIKPLAGLIPTTCPIARHRGMLPSGPRWLIGIGSFSLGLIAYSIGWLYVKTCGRGREYQFGSDPRFRFAVPCFLVACCALYFESFVAGCGQPDVFLLEGRTAHHVTTMSETFSVLATVQLLWDHSLCKLAAAIFIFSVCFPLVKILMIACTWWDCSATLRTRQAWRKRLMSFLCYIGRSSMLDFYVMQSIVCLLSVKVNITDLVGVEIYVRPLYGFLAFTLATLLLTIVGHIVMDYSSYQLKTDSVAAWVPWTLAQRCEFMCILLALLAAMCFYVAGALYAIFSFQIDGLIGWFLNKFGAGGGNVFTLNLFHSIEHLYALSMNTSELFTLLLLVVHLLMSYVIPLLFLAVAIFSSATELVLARADGEGILSLHHQAFRLYTLSAADVMAISIFIAVSEMEGRSLFNDSHVIQNLCGYLAKYIDIPGATPDARNSLLALAVTYPLGLKLMLAGAILQVVFGYRFLKLLEAKV